MRATNQSPDPNRCKLRTTTARIQQKKKNTPIQHCRPAQEECRSVIKETPPARGHTSGVISISHDIGAGHNLHPRNGLHAVAVSGGSTQRRQLGTYGLPFGYIEVAVYIKNETREAVANRRCSGSHVVTQRTCLSEKKAGE